jgi:hypothetical protein
VRRKKASSKETASSDSFSSGDSDTSMNGRGLKTAGLSDNNGCEIESKALHQLHIGSRVLEVETAFGGEPQPSWVDVVVRGFLW